MEAPVRPRLGSVDRKPPRQLGDVVAHRRLDGSVARFAVRRQAVERLDDQVADLRELRAPKPREVAAGEPRRMPEVTIGFCGSNGMPFLLQVMWARPSAASAALPVRPLRRQIDQHQMVVGAAR